MNRPNGLRTDKAGDNPTLLPIVSVVAVIYLTYYLVWRAAASKACRSSIIKSA